MTLFAHFPRVAYYPACSVLLLFFSNLVLDLVPPHDFGEDGKTAVDDDVGGGGVGAGHVAENLDGRVHQTALDESDEVMIAGIFYVKVKPPE